MGQKAGEKWTAAAKLQPTFPKPDRLLGSQPGTGAGRRRDNRPAMHLIVPFAGCMSEAGRQAQQTLQLPQLEKLLARWQASPALGTDEYSLNPPHEQALALALGWPAGTATLAQDALPWAALAAARRGLPGAGQAAWGQLTPVQLVPGREQIRLGDPADLQLDEAASRELLQIVRPLFESEGVLLHWLAPLQWLASHESFDALPCASLDRVVGRHLDPWLPPQRAARLLRRLQNEVQMLMYTHPVNEQREAAGLPVFNSVWLSGCGRLPAAWAAGRPIPPLDDRLRRPALTEDWAAWCEAWQALDAGPLASMLQAGEAGRLTLCGERHAVTWAAAPRGLWQRLSASWRPTQLHSVLDAL